MLTELLRFLLNRSIFNRYSGYRIHDLVAGDKVTKVVYETIKSIHDLGSDKDVTPDEVALLSRDRLSNDESVTLQALIEDIRHVNISNYSEVGIRRAFENAYRRNLAAYLAASALPALSNGEALDIAEILGVLEEGSNRIEARDTEIDYTAYVETEAKPLKTIPTYIKGLDEAINGGLSPGQLGSFVGWPGIGKTLLLGQSAALSYYNGLHAGLITLEISKEETARRLDKLFARGTDEFTQLTATAKERGGKLTILDGAAESFTPGAAMAFLESWKRRGNPISVLFIDYADLMETGRNLEDYNELGEIYKQLRRIGTKFDIPIWTASQAVRGAMDKRLLTLGDIADSFKKARIADVIVTINQTPQEQQNGDMRLYIAKSRRNKGHPIVHMQTDFDRMRVISGEVRE